MSRGLMVDATPGLFPAGGIGRYVRDICAALELPGAPPARLAYPRDLRTVARDRHAATMLYELGLTRWQLNLLLAASAATRAPLDALYGRPGVFHSTMGSGPRFANGRLVCQVHDLTAIEHPEWFPPRTRGFVRATLGASARAADVVLTHSRHVARRVHEVLGVDEARIETLAPPLGRGIGPMGSQEAAVRLEGRFGLAPGVPFLLQVGTLEPRKNHVATFGAFERLCRDGFPGPLIVVGQPGWLTAPILARLEASPSREQIHRVIDADDADLSALYTACTATVFPSLDEGFGLPLLEAMACGAPCVFSDLPVLLELAAEGSIAVPPRDEDALAEAMRSLWKDPVQRAAAAAAGPVRAAEYAFDRWRERLLALYRRELARADA